MIKRKKLKLLLIEDSVVSTQMVKDALMEQKAQKFAIETTESLYDGIDLLKRNRFDLILLDLNLPDSFGINTLITLLSNEKDTPIVIVSAIEDEAIAIQSLTMGAQDYLLKGDIDGNILIRSIQYSIKRKQIEEELRKSYEHLEIRVNKRTAELIAVNEKLREEIAERKRTEDELEIYANNLYKRIMELRCIYGISDIIDRQDISFDKKIQDIVNLVPSAFQHQNSTCVRVTLDDKEFRTYNLGETPWALSCDIIVQGKKGGTIDVFYLEERQQAQEGPFLQEERDLIDAIAQRLGRFVERVRVTKALEESEKEYCKLVETLHEGVWVIDRVSRTTFVNPRMAEILGFPEEEMIGKHLFDFMDERGREIAQRWLERRREGIKEQHDFEFIRKDGVRIFALLETSPIIDENGVYIGAVAGVQDITERKKIEHELSVSETRYRRLFETAKDGILILDAITGRILDVNPFLVSMLGYSHEEFSGKTLWEIGSFKDIEASKTAFLELQEKEYIRYEDLPLMTKDGRSINVEFISNVYPVDHTKVIQCNIRDITDRRMAEQERERLVLDLQDALSKIKTLSGLLPICASCKKIRDDTGYWNQLEKYISEYADVTFSHSYCPECAKKAVQDYGEDKAKKR